MIKKNSDNNSSSKVIYHYPPVSLSSEEKANDFHNIWPEIEKLFDGDEPDLFKKLSLFIYCSFAGSLSSHYTPEELYEKFRSYYDFFIRDFDTANDPETNTPRAKVYVDPSSDRSLEQGGSKIAITRIMIHAVDSPFLFENLTGYLNINGFQILSGIHPMLTVKRDNGKIVDILLPVEEGPKEIFIKFQIKKVVNPKNITKLGNEIRSIVKALYLSVGDFPGMIKRIKRFCDELEKDTVAPEDAKETAEFLKWLLPDHFILMGMARYDIKGGKLNQKGKSLFGVYRNIELMDTVFPGLNGEIEKRIVNSFERPFMMVVDFHTNSPSIIYHREMVDVVFVRQYGADGAPVAVTVFIGRFSRGGIMSKSSDIPFLRKKLDRLIASENIIPRSHLHREIATAFNQLPKRELFYIDRKTLAAVLKISTSLQSDYECHLLVRHNPQFEYITVILIFSAKKYSLDNLAKIKEYLCNALKLENLYQDASQGVSVAKAFFYFRTEDGAPKIDAEKMTHDLRNILMTWDDLLVEKLVDKFDDKLGFERYNRYRKRLTDLYKQAAPPEDAVGDLVKMDELEKTNTLQLDITCRSPVNAHLRIYWNKELDLMKLIPTFRNLGLHVKEEIALPLKSQNGDKLYIQLLLLEDSEERIALLEEHKDKLIEAIRLVIAGEAEDCGLNRLVLSAGFNWRQIDMIRAYSNYILQVNKSLNPTSVTGAINKYTTLLAKLVDYFLEKFDPDKGNKERIEEIEVSYEKSLGDITDLTEDSIMRLLFNVVKSTLRTNYFKSLEYHYISFKIDCKSVQGMPKPVPIAEIFVHSPFIDGVHLRGGRVARGGLRWSDRPDDFRTEVLGLVKTQMVKNSVIVPAGSKGGFIIKKMRFGDLTDRDEIYKNLYQSFIKGLLDLTDNMVKGQPKPPKDVVCFDEPDPYLVVAADKGTATMSDSANEISENYGFWLKDAFASGGAIGYDHKKYGITARGAWECVKRHFRELKIDVQSESITVAGIGDMAGDVFGNGMLLSEKIKLVAAFNHKHIFLDPDPDPAQSFEERKRLFEMGNVGRCQWTDYNPDLISKGGGVFLRSAKAIPISEHMQKLLDIDKASLSGRELIRAILKMPVDLLYCGGIGTYIRASDESDLDVGDKANDSVRVAADKLRARVIGEGANLALTQKARVEYAIHGGTSNTDAIDNAGGVNMSDHEVNIKIFLEILLERKELKSQKKRNKFFMEIGGEVADKVLRDNYMQSSGISLDKSRSVDNLERFCDYIDQMESKGCFERVEEDIPQREELLEYARKPGYMPKPILAELFGHEKLRLKEEIMSSKLVEYAFTERYFTGYFPSVIQRDYSAHLDEHRLKNEIIATVLSNKIVNQAGVTFVYSIEKATDRSPAEICKTYLIVENLLQADEFRKMAHELDNIIPAKKQIGFLLQMENLIAKVVTWMLKHTESDRVSFDFINQYQVIINTFKNNLYEKLESICSMEEGCIDEKVDKLKNKNVPEPLAKWSVILPYLKDIMSIVKIKETKHTEFIDTGNLFIQVTNDLEIDWVSNALEKKVLETAWEKRSMENLLAELEQRQYHIVMNILEFKRKGEDMNTAFHSYTTEKEIALKQYKKTIAKIKSENPGDLLALGVLIRMMAALD